MEVVGCVNSWVLSLGRGFLRPTEGGPAVGEGVDFEEYVVVVLFVVEWSPVVGVCDTFAIGS